MKLGFIGTGMITEAIVVGLMEAEFPLSEIQKDLVALAEKLPVDETPQGSALKLAAIQDGTEETAGDYVKYRAQRFVSSRRA